MAFSLVVTSLIVGIAGFSVFGLFMLIASIEFVTDYRHMAFRRWLLAILFWLTIGVSGMYSYFWLNTHSG
jgi:hypothetical protein